MGSLGLLRRKLTLEPHSPVRNPCGDPTLKIGTDRRVSLARQGSSANRRAAAVMQGGDVNAVFTP
jgi:hypothetical protein